jgi:curved DNA-binding protein CbpA
MSAPLAGKFQDHYTILGIDPKSDMDRILAAYTKVSEKYHPDNPETGDQEKFDAVAMAFEVLSDPALRREFDKLKGVDKDDGQPRFSGLPFFEALGRESRLRVAMLCVLYDRRRTKPFTPSISMRQLENSVHATEAELNFALWYLKQRSYAGQDDKSSLLITVEGMDYLETNRPEPDSVMPFIKAAALAAVPEEASEASAVDETGSAGLAELETAVRGQESEPEAEKAMPEKVAPVKAPESVMQFMRRARERG